MDALNMGAAAHGGGCRVTLIDARDVAQWTGRDRATVRKWVSRGWLEPSACDVRTRALLYRPSAVSKRLFPKPRVVN